MNQQRDDDKELIQRQYWLAVTEEAQRDFPLNVGDQIRRTDQTPVVFGSIKY